MSLKCAVRAVWIKNISRCLLRRDDRSISDSFFLDEKRTKKIKTGSLPPLFYIINGVGEAPSSLFAKKSEISLRKF